MNNPQASDCVVGNDIARNSLELEQARHTPWTDVTRDPCDCIRSGTRLETIDTHDLPSDGWLMLCRCPECSHIFVILHGG